MRKKRLLRVTRTVIVSSIDVFYNEKFVGFGLSYWDGENIMTDIVDLNGKILPPDWYTIHTIGEPQLAVYSETIQ
jgi:hypothetical protein